MHSERQPTLVLASTSPYRRRLLERLQLPFDCHAPGIDETPRSGETARQLAQRLALAKARAVSISSPGALVIGSDQAASVAGTLLSKPGTAARARQQLQQCSNRTVTFHTAVVLCRAGAVLDQSCTATDVDFRNLGEMEIADYVARDQPLDCAGSFRWEGLGISLFRALRSDDPTALEGLPLIAVVNMLRAQGVPVIG